METGKDVTSRGRGGATQTGKRGRPRTRAVSQVPLSPSTRNKRTRTVVDAIVTPKKKNKGSCTPVKDLKPEGPDHSPRRQLPQNYGRSSGLPVEDEQAFLCSSSIRPDEETCSSPFHHFVTVTECKSQAATYDLKGASYTTSTVCTTMLPAQAKDRYFGQLNLSPSPYEDNTPARRLPSSKLSVAQKKANSRLNLIVGEANNSADVHILDSDDTNINVEVNEIINISSTDDEDEEQDTLDKKSTQGKSVDIVESDNIVNVTEVSETSSSPLSIAEDTEQGSIDEENLTQEISADADVVFLKSEDTNPKVNGVSGSFPSDGDDEEQDTLEETSSPKKSDLDVDIFEDNVDSEATESSSDDDEEEDQEQTTEKRLGLLGCHIM